MSGFWKFTVANFRMFLRDYQTVFWIFLFPILFMSLLGVAFGSINDVTFNVAVIDNDDTIGSEMFIDSLEEVSALELTTGRSMSYAKDEMQNGNMDLIIIIPEGFQNEVLKNIDLSNSSINLTMFPSSGYSMDSILLNMTNQSSSGSKSVNITVLYNDANADKSFSALAIVEKVSLNLNKQLTGREDIIAIVPEKSTGGDFEFIDYLAPGIVAMSIMQTGIFGMSMFIVSAREKGILKRIQATPVSPAYLLAARIMVSVAVMGLQTVILLTIAVLVFGVEIVGNPFLLASMVIMGALVFIMLGFIISSFSKTTESAESFSNVISLPMMFLGDVFIPISVLPDYVQLISKALPLTYLSDTYRKVMLHGAGIEDIWTNVVILIIFGLIMFAGAVKLFRWDK
jgi:ABC-2 type transport system permease protein